MINDQFINNVIKDLKKAANPKKANHSQRFFKTGEGEYAEGDVFLGVGAQNSKRIAKKYKDISINQIFKLIKNKYHEVRLVALLIAVRRYKLKSTTDKDKKEIYKQYLIHTDYINNWDLVDISSYKILGHYLYHHPNEISILDNLAFSDSLWERRIGMISCFYLIKNMSFDYPLKIASTLLLDPHDLIHKAVGWMLREIGKRDLSVLEEFLEVNKKQMPRTMLRYAIEKMTKDKYYYYLTSSK